MKRGSRRGKLVTSKRPGRGRECARSVQRHKQSAVGARCRLWWWCLSHRGPGAGSGKTCGNGSSQRRSKRSRYVQACEHSPWAWFLHACMSTRLETFVAVQVVVMNYRRRISYQSLRGGKGSKKRPSSRRASWHYKTPACAKGSGPGQCGR